MAVKKITEVSEATALKSDACLLATQQMTGEDGASNETLVRAKINAVITALGLNKYAVTAKIEADGAKQVLVIMQGSGDAAQDVARLTLPGMDDDYNTALGENNSVNGHGVTVIGVGNTVGQCADGAIIAGSNMTVADPTVVAAFGDGEKQFRVYKDGTIKTSGTSYATSVMFEYAGGFYTGEACYVYINGSIATVKEVFNLLDTGTVNVTLKDSSVYEYDPVQIISATNYSYLNDSANQRYEFRANFDREKSFCVKYKKNGSDGEGFYVYENNSDIDIIAKSDFPAGASVSRKLVKTETKIGASPSQSFAYPRIAWLVDDNYILTYNNTVHCATIKNATVTIHASNDVISDASNLFPARFDEDFECEDYFVFYCKTTDNKYYICCRKWDNEATALAATEHTIVSSDYGVYEPFYFGGKLYYSAEHDISKSYQNIESVTLSYDTTTDQFTVGAPEVVISGKNQVDYEGNTVANSRPGFNAITTLADGSYLMVFETNINNHGGDYPYVVQYCYSKDLSAWTTPKTLFCEKGGYVNIPYVSTSDDGTILVSYHTRSGYFGVDVTPTINKRIYRAFTSNNAVKYGDELRPNQFTEFPTYRNRENEWTGGWGSSFIYEGVATPVYMVGNNATGTKYLYFDFCADAEDFVTKDYLTSASSKNAVGDTLVQRTASGHIRAATPTSTSTTSDGDVVVTKKWIGKYRDAHELYLSTNGKGYNPETGTYYTLTSTLYNAVKANPAQYKVYLAAGDCCYPCGVVVSGSILRVSCTVYNRGGQWDVTYTTYYVGNWSSSGITWDIWDAASDPCLIEGTPINMADGGEVAVENLRAGDIVQSYNPVTGENVPAVVIAAYMTGTARKYKVYSFANGKHLTIYGLHGFYDKRSGATKDIQTITMDDKPVDISGTETQLITSRELLFHGEKKRRYNVITSNNLYFANGILLGSKPFSRMQYLIDRGLTVPDEIRAVWQADTDAYNAYSGFLDNPAYHAEIAAAYSNLAKAVHHIKVNKKRLSDSDYKVQKFTEGLLTLAEWAEAKAKRAAWRKEVNDNEALRDTAKATVDAIIAKYRGGKTPRAIFEECCARDNALFETVKAYFTQSGGEDV